MNIKRMLAVLALAGSCGQTTDDFAEDRESRDLRERGGQTNNDFQNVLSVADGMFDFDPTIDAAASAETNAQAIRDNAAANLSGCGSVALEGTSITLDFGTGCTFGSFDVAGSVTASVSRSGSTTLVELEFGNLSVEGSTPLTGSASFSTFNGSTFTVALDLTQGSTTGTADLTVVGTAGAFTLDGTASVRQGDKTTSVMFTGVHYAKGDCYPDGGTVKVQQSVLTVTITFLSTTPDDGLVTVKQGRKTYSKPLPAYGSCPPSA